MLMKMSDFWIYDEKNESPDDIYWKFVNASDDELNDLYFPDISDVIRKVKNVDLKEKMKNKLFYLIKKKGILYESFCLDLFNESEKENLIESDSFYDRFIAAVNEHNMYSFFSTVLNFSDILFKFDNFDFQVSNFSRIIDVLKNCDDSSSYIAKLINNTKSNLKLYNYLVEKYYDFLPLDYKNFIRISNDRNYILNKARKCADESIGIDSNIKIGLEIETNNSYGLFFSLLDQYGYEDFGYVHYDATVYNGIEISCKPFKDDTFEVVKFHALCDALTEMGYHYDEIFENASGQINLGLDYLDSKQAVINFYEIYGNCEELLFYISNEVGQLFRQEVYINSRIKPLSEIIGTRVIDENMSREDFINLFRIKNDGTSGINGLLYKKNSVCVRGSGDSLRFEFRIPNGGNNFSTWKDNIRLYGKIMEVSKKLADFMDKDYLTFEEERLLRLKLDLQDKSLSLEDKLVVLMDLLSFDDSIKQIYYDRYDSVIDMIRKTGSRKYTDFDYRVEPAFDEVNFFEKYESRYDGNFDVSYDPNTGEYIEKKSRVK